MRQTATPSVMGGAHRGQSARCAEAASAQALRKAVVAVYGHADAPIPPQEGGFLFRELSDKHPGTVESDWSAIATRMGLWPMETRQPAETLMGRHRADRDFVRRTKRHDIPLPRVAASLREGDRCEGLDEYRGLVGTVQEVENAHDTEGTPVPGAWVLWDNAQWKGNWMPFIKLREAKQ